MKIVNLVPLLLAFAGATADIPQHHHQRFLVERSTLVQELAEWNRSEAEQIAPEHGYYTEPPVAINSTTQAHEDHMRL